MSENKARVIPYSIVYHYYDDVLDTNTCYIRYFETEGEMYYWAARFYAFHDLDDSMEIDAMYNSGREFVYVGWQPDMLIEFVDKATRIPVYAAEFPELDH